MYILTPLGPLLPAPFFDPVETRKYFRVSAEVYDEQVVPLLTAAMSAAEGYTGTALFERSWELVTDSLSSGYLPGWMAKDATALTAHVGTTATNVLSSVRLVRDYLTVVSLPPAEFYTLAFKRGYTAELLPPSVLQAVRVMALDWYDNRTDGPRQLPSLSEKLLGPHIIYQ